LKPFLLSIVFAFLLTKQISAQAPGYTFASSAGTYTAITGGTQHSSGSGMDDATFSVTLPFSFNFNGTNFTQVYLSENGYVSFGATDPGTSTRSAISSAPILALLWLQPFQETYREWVLLLSYVVK
jgi:hypothetical protein